MQIVTPCAQWTYQESHNLRGSPATHAVEDGSDKTLCGKVPDGWMWQNWNGADMLELVTCKNCKRLLTKRGADLSKRGRTARNRYFIRK